MLPSFQLILRTTKDLLKYGILMGNMDNFSPSCMESEFEVCIVETRDLRQLVSNAKVLSRILHISFDVENTNYILIISRQKNMLDHQNEQTKI